MDVIACEDTRTTRQLFNSQFKGSVLIACHEHNEEEQTRKIAVS